MERRSFGVLYYVDENPRFRQMLELSLASLRRFHPDWPVHVVNLPSFATSWWRTGYRWLSFWKWHKRFARANQDFRMIEIKADIMLDSPFDCTLYLDADTFVLKPLDGLRNRALQADVLVTPLGWKNYHRMADWHPASFPYYMAGVTFYSERFRKMYRSYVDKVGEQVKCLPTADQFIFSLALHVERSQLRIIEEPHLQFDVLNAEQHFARAGHDRHGKSLNIEDLSQTPFHVFHYNHDKPKFIRQIRRSLNLECS